MTVPPREISSFQTSVRDILRMKDGEIPLMRLQQLKNLTLVAGKCIELEIGVDLPDPRMSGALLDVMANEVSFVERLAPKITLSEMGCWQLPLAAEYDSKNRARYPQISDSTEGIRNALAHRAMMTICLGATLRRLDQIEHICRSHACCNLTHLDFATPGQNSQRKYIYYRTVKGQPRLF